MDGVAAKRSLFGSIRHTRDRSPQGVLSAYSDNAAVLAGSQGARFFPAGAGHAYGWHEEPVDILIKVETHNHPTAISPFAGAATGSGGEIRDEGATGRGAKPKAGLVGFTVSNLRISGTVVQGQCATFQDPLPVCYLSRPLHPSHHLLRVAPRV